MRKSARMKKGMLRTKASIMQWKTDLGHHPLRQLDRPNPYKPKDENMNPSISLAWRVVGVGAIFVVFYTFFSFWDWIVALFERASK